MSVRHSFRAARMAHFAVAPSIASLALAAVTTTASADGRIIAIGDEWVFSDLAFGEANQAATIFALNCAELLVGPSGSILAYSSNVALTGTALPSLLAGHGYVFTQSTAAPFTLATLMQYESVWLAGVPGSGSANAQVLVDYVHAGGNVLVSAATGAFAGGAPGEAAAWSPFLGAFGLAFGTDWFPSPGLVTPPIYASSNPAVQGVTTLVWGYGQTAFELNPSNPLTDAILANFAEFGAGDKFVIATYLPPCSSLCPADLDGSGTVNAADLSVLLGGWGAAGTADITCDGVIDAMDLAALLGAWGRCPA